MMLDRMRPMCSSAKVHFLIEQPEQNWEDELECSQILSDESPVTTAYSSNCASGFS